MRRHIALAITALMPLGVLAGPAAAENKVYVIVPGQGFAEVSKTPFFAGGDTCTRTDIPGTGLGLPVVNGAKTGYWRVEADLIIVPPVVAATLVACGRLDPVARRVTGGGIGAACGMSKGYDGIGRIEDAIGGYTVHIQNLMWKTSGAGGIIAIGHVTWSGKESGKGVGKIVAKVTARGGLPCLTKSSGPGVHKKRDKSFGAAILAVDVTLEVIQDPGGDVMPKWKDLPGSEKGAQDNPAFCKAEDAGQCPIYGPKKQHEGP